MGCYSYGFRVWCLQELDGSYWLTLMTRICRLSELELWPHTQRFVKWIDIGLIFCLPTPIGWVVLTLASIYIYIYIHQICIQYTYVYIYMYIYNVSNLYNLYMYPNFTTPNCGSLFFKIGTPDAGQVTIRTTLVLSWWFDMGGFHPTRWTGTFSNHLKFDSPKVWKVLSQTLGHSDLASPFLECFGVPIWFNTLSTSSHTTNGLQGRALSGA